MAIIPSLAPDTIYNCYVAYFWDYGVRPVPVAGVAGTPLEVVDEHAPCCFKVVSFTCQAYDGNPAVPDPDVNSSSNEVLIQKVLSKPFIMELQDGSPVVTVAGVYMYLLLVPPSDQDPLNFGVPPYDPISNVLLPSDFIQGLLGGFQPSGQGTFGGVIPKIIAPQ